MVKRPSGLVYTKHKENPTSFGEGNIPWNKGTKGLMTAWNKGIKGSVKPNKTSFKAGQEPWNKGKEFEAIKGENHPLWKGDKVSYQALHCWLLKNRAKSTCCDHCGEHEKKLDWANKTGNYLRAADDWLTLCRSCHTRYDKKRKTHERKHSK